MEVSGTSSAAGAASSMVVPGAVAVSTVGATSGSRVMMQSTNPLQNPDILEHFFKHCDSFQLLRECRLVCKQWLELSQKQWRSVGALTLRFDFEDSSPPAILPDVLEFIQNPVNNCNTVPFKKLCLYNWRNNEHLTGLWNVFENLKELTLAFYKMDDVEQFREIIFRRCPNLERLTLQDASFIFGRGGGEPMGIDRDTSALEELERAYEYKAPQFGEQTQLKSLTIVRGKLLEEKLSWMELLSHFPALSSLELQFIKPELSGELLKVIQLIRQQEPERNLHFTSIDATFMCEADHSPGWPCNEVPELKLEIIKELGLPIEKLEISYNAEADLRDIANEAISYSANHFKELKVSSEWCRTRYLKKKNFWPKTWKLPEGVELTKLKKLDVFYNCDSLEFLRSTPNLADLFVEDKFGRACNPNVAEELKQKPLLNLTKLYLLKGVKKEDLQRFGDWMPNLERMKIPMDDEEFGIVCEGLKKLKYLSVTGQLLGDEGIIGNIGLLEGLEKFAFYSKKVTDVSVFEGLLQLPKLRKVFPVERSDFGEAARKALKAKGIVRYSAIEEEYSGSDNYEDEDDDSGDEDDDSGDEDDDSGDEDGEGNSGDEDAEGNSGDEDGEGDSGDEHEDGNSGVGEGGDSRGDEIDKKSKVGDGNDMELVD